VTWSIVIPYRLEAVETYLYSVSGEKMEKISLAPVFAIPVRKDLIRRAFLSAFTARLQPKGRDPLAGKRTTARSWGVGRGMARVPRIPSGRAAFISFARGGHRAFPPKPDRKIHERINKKEMALAIASALAATARKEFVVARGHVFTVDTLPVVIEDGIEDNITKSKEARELLKKLGLWQDVVRAQRRIRIRAGKGKMRGRRYVEPKSILFVISSSEKPFRKAVGNFPGVDVVTPELLSILHLAPGGVPGRLTVFTKSALMLVSKKFEVITP